MHAYTHTRTWAQSHVHSHAHTHTHPHAHLLERRFNTYLSPEEAHALEVFHAYHVAL